MSFAKEDELLQKLQKCVGRLQNKTGNTQRYSLRQTQRYVPADTPRNRESKQQYSFRQSSVEPSREINRGNYQSNRPRWSNKNNDVEYLNQGRNQQKGFSYNTTNTTHDLAQRITERTPNNIEPQGILKEQRRRPADQIRNKYQDQVKHQIGQTSKRKSYLQNSVIPRAPLRDYDMNNLANMPQNNKQNFQKRQPRKYLEENHYEMTQDTPTPKYQSHRKQESVVKGEAYRRNSISHNVSYNENLNRTAQKESNGYCRNIDYTNKMEKYDLKDKQNVGSGQIKPFLGNARNFSSKQQTREPMEKTENIKEGFQGCRDSQIRQMSSRQRARNSGVGSISSAVKKNQLESSSINYQTFQPKEQRQLNLKQILDEVGNTNQDTYTKLQKISQLNQRINKRIKNIIQTFQNK